jgi:hypothetical protein
VIKLCKGPRKTVFSCYEPKSSPEDSFRTTKFAYSLNLRRALLHGFGRRSTRVVYQASERIGKRRRHARPTAMVEAESLTSASEGDSKWCVEVSSTERWTLPRMHHLTSYAKHNKIACHCEIVVNKVQNLGHDENA